MQEFRNLNVWNKSHKLVLRIYHISKFFPQNEIYGLTSQIRRAASSIPTNIAEGCGRETNKDFARFLYISIGSASELEYLILLINDLEILDNYESKKIIDEIIEIRKMLLSLINKLRE